MWSFEVFVENLDFEFLLIQWSQMLWFSFYILYVPFIFEMLSLLIYSWKGSSFTAGCAFDDFFFCFFLLFCWLFLMLLLLFLYFLLFFVFELINKF